MTDVQASLVAHAVLLGERIELRGLPPPERMISQTPLAWRTGEGGLVVLYRYGAAVFFGLPEAARAGVVEMIRERIVDAWLASGEKLDLIASALTDIDASGRAHATIVPSDLSAYRNAADWLARPPHVVGAAQAWTRRVFDRFGPLPEGTVAEDLIMVFRAIVSGGASTLAEPLVLYRRGGLSRRRRALHARDVVAGLLRNNRHSLVELPQLLADAKRAGQLAAVEAALTARLARERYIDALFRAPTAGARWRAFAEAREVPAGTRLRMLVYAAAPALLAPLFFVKRVFARNG